MYAPVILKKHAQRLRKETGNQNMMTEQEARRKMFAKLLNSNLYLTLKLIVEEPMLDLMCAFVDLIYALLYAFFSAYPVIFNDLYGFGDEKVGLMYIPILIGAMSGICLTPILEKQYVALKKI
ncbi:hypothetical protein METBISCDRAFT_21916 [Metschnikowia bicuspidata]|uniref:Uncharacterized protein n=1 Tax=Metschnikowia bicuspidata TaxID=27322 RepID=A0A4P9ZIX4_9ASCO|nr:hypothetical protein METBISCDRAFT_21916 [Metschnikowia bicuspidata]